MVRVSQILAWLLLVGLECVTAAAAQEAEPAPSQSAPPTAAGASADDEQPGKPSAKEKPAPAEDKPAGEPSPSDDADSEQPRPGRSRRARGGQSDESSPTEAPEKPVVDFSGGAGKPAARGDELPAETKRLKFNFRFAPWKEVLELFAKEARLTLDLNEVPTGTFNYFDDGVYTPTEALDVLNGYLLRKGYVLVRRDRFLVVHNLDNPIPPNLIPQVSLSDLPQRGKNELMSVVLPLSSHVDAKVAAEEITSLLGPQGKVVPQVKFNRLFVTDIGSNLRQIHELLSGIGDLVDSSAMAFRSFKLKHVTAGEAERMVRDLFALPARGLTARTTTTPAPAPRTDTGDGRDGRGGRGMWGRGNWPGMQGGGFPGAGGGFPGAGGAPGGGFPWGGGMPGGGGGGNETPANPQQQNSQQATPVAKIQLTIDARTNSLLVNASGADMLLIEKAIETIDVVESEERSSLTTGANVPQLEVYLVEKGDLQVAVDMLNAMVPGLLIREDPKARRISVYAAPDEQKQVRGIIKQLESGDGGDTVSVIQLRKQEAVAVAVSLRGLFGGNKADAPSIEADAVGRRLMVRGTPEQVSQIRKVLTEMGEDGTGTPHDSTGDGPLRTVSTGSRSAEDLVALVQKLMPQAEGSFIRVVPSATSGSPSFRLRDSNLVPEGRPIPGQRGADSSLEDQPPRGGPAIERRPRRSPLPADTAPPKPASAASRLQSEGRSRIPDLAESNAETERLARELDAALEELENDADEEDEPAGPATSAIESEPNGEADAGAASPVVSGQGSLADGVARETPIAGDAAKVSSGADDEAEIEGMADDVRITVVGGKILLASENLKALDRLERLLQSLTQAGGAPRTKWTVKYLQVADATETSTILGSLFPQGTVARTAEGGNSGFMSSLTGSLSSLGGSLMDATGMGSLGQSQPLRIVPELRSNSLFITGPEEQVNQVLEAIDVLDRSELPPSLKDRTARMVAVEHADVEDVAEIVKDVYKEQLEPPQANPAAQGGRGGQFNPLAMLMGAGGNQNGKQKGVLLSIGVDTRTSTLIVSASEQLHREIEALVEALDDAALEAKRTVRVARVSSASAQLIQDSLKPLLGKVKVSSTSSGNANRPNQPPQGGPGGGGMPFAPGGGNNPMQGLMMQRMMQGGGMQFGAPGGNPFGGGNFGGRGGNFGGGRGGNFGGGRGRGN
ncbi:MAG: secretin N-terminal domain-containing protein [Planctomycetales bacterium]